MSFIEAIKNVAKRVLANVVSAVNRLTTQDVVVSEGGEIIIREPLVKSISDKLSAFVLASAALFFLLAPLQGKTTMAIGDQLLRAATTLWSGTEAPDGAGVPA